MKTLWDIVWEIVGRIAYDGIPSLFRRDLPKPIHRLRLAAWTVVIAGAVLFFLTDVPSLAAHRRLFKSAVLGGVVLFVALLVAMTLLGKRWKR